MARLNDKQREMILSDFHIGKSQNELAKKYDVSPATINKLCKGVIPKYKDKVNEVVSIKSELSKESEYQSECFNKEVNDKLRRSGIVFGAMEKLAQLTSKTITNNKIIDKINVGDGVQQFEPRELNTSDYKNIADTLEKVGKSFGIIESDKAVINNTNANQVNAPTQINIVRDN